MAINKRSEAIEEAVNRLLEEDDVYSSSGLRCYARVASSAFERIASLREKGIGYDRICKSFETSGLLPENADIQCLGQAFRRERAKRSNGVKNAKVPIFERSGSDTVKKSAVPFVKAETSIKKTTAGTADDEAADKELIRKLTSTTVNTGLGNIVKHSDGSFDFD
ncbi:hypothetical protein AGMMS49957_10850 [Synergistales bacterium]|nr:hypothetical protein AGMMS49957_10850 [Synergistales bacterium]